MANYDGPAYVYPTMYTALGGPNPGYQVPYWTTQGTWVQAPNFGGGGGAPTTPEGDPIYGYGWGLSG